MNELLIERIVQLGELVNWLSGARWWKLQMKLFPTRRTRPPLFQLAGRTGQRKCKRREKGSVKGVLENDKGRTGTQ